MGFWAWLGRGKKYCQHCGHEEHTGVCNHCQDTCPWFTRCSLLDLRPIETSGQFGPGRWAPKLGGAYPTYGDGYRRASPRHYQDTTEDELRTDIGCLRHHPWEYCDCKQTPCPICGGVKYDIMALCGACWYKGRELPAGTNDERK